MRSVQRLGRVAAVLGLTLVISASTARTASAWGHDRYVGTVYVASPTVYAAPVATSYVVPTATVVSAPVATSYVIPTAAVVSAPVATSYVVPTAAVVPAPVVTSYAVPTAAVYTPTVYAAPTVYAPVQYVVRGRRLRLLYP
jgi:hypothetical protein